MADIGWQFPAILITAMLLSMAFTLLQHRRYVREVHTVAAGQHGPHDMLVTGRGRSFRGGAIVVLVVDRDMRTVTTARLMKGWTVFARFADAPQLLGPLDSATDRVTQPQVKEAVAMAAAQVPPRSRRP